MPFPLVVTKTVFGWYHLVSAGCTQWHENLALRDSIERSYVMLGSCNSLPLSGSLFCLDLIAFIFLHSYNYVGNQDDVRRQSCRSTCPGWVSCKLLSTLHLVGSVVANPERLCSEWENRCWWALLSLPEWIPAICIWQSYTSLAKRGQMAWASPLKQGGIWRDLTPVLLGQCWTFLLRWDSDHLDHPFPVGFSRRELFFWRS